MDAEWGMDTTLDEFLLARIAEDSRRAMDAAAAAGGEHWSVDALPGRPPEHPAAERPAAERPAAERPAAERPAAEHMARYDPARIRAECNAKRRIVMACRQARPNGSFLGARARGPVNFPPAPEDQHQLAALTLALLALPYASHRDYREQWRP